MILSQPIVGRRRGYFFVGGNFVGGQMDPNFPGKHYRRGFTLIELLVVIAIIGTLVGLLLPAVQSARESARRSSCSNNMKQTALALHNYHDANGCLPSGQTTSGPTGGKRAGWFVYLLPFVEYADLYSRMNWSLLALQNSSVINTPVPVVWCPSDPYSRTVKPRGIFGNYSGNIGAMALDNAWGNGSDGIFYKESKMKMKNITDGLSKTLVLGETLVSPILGTNSEPRGLIWDSELIGYGFNARNEPNSGTIDNIQYCQTSTDSYWQQWTPCTSVGGTGRTVAARSQHPGGVQVALMDGSVGFINNSIQSWAAGGVPTAWNTPLDPTKMGVWQKLACRYDGQAVSPFGN